MKRTVLTLIIFFFLLLVPSIYADNNATTSAKVQVDHIAGGIEKFREKIDLWFAFSSDKKTEIQENQLEKRLAEVSYIVNKKHLDQLEETSSRYSTTAGKFTNYIVQKKLSNKKQQIIDQFTQHQVVIKNLEESIEYGSGLWMLLEHDYNALTIYKNQLTNI